MPAEPPQISVIIPSHGRPHLIGRAVKSALGQTLENIEVIVVLDGPDEASLAALYQFDDRRLKIKQLSSNHGLGEARNSGVREALSSWIAFLDDDDEWLPRKLELQIKAAEKSPFRYPVITCRVIARDDTGDSVWPRRLPGKNEHLSEYLLRSRTRGETAILAITIFTPKALLKIVPFRNLPFYEDFDWLLRVNMRKDVFVQFISDKEPQAICHMNRDPSRISNRLDWRFSLALIRSIRGMVTPKAYASFILLKIASEAQNQGEWRACVQLLKESRRGSPAPLDILIFLLIWLIPHDLRRFIASSFGL